MNGIKMEMGIISREWEQQYSQSRTPLVQSLPELRYFEILMTVFTLYSNIIPPAAKTFLNLAVRYRTSALVIILFSFRIHSSKR